MEQKTLLKNKKNQGNSGDYGNEGNQMSHSEQMIENQFIQILSEKENQWTYRPDLKSEEALWQNFRSHLNRINLAVLGEQPLTDKEFKQVKVEFSRLTGTPFLASQWLRGENGVAQILLEREDGKKVTLSFDFLQSAMNEYQSDKKTIPYLTHLLDSMTLSKEEFEAKTGEKYRRRTKVLEERLQQNFEQLQKWKEEL